MGLSFSSNTKIEELPQPFTYKHKIKGLDILRGPIGRDKFIILDDDFEGEIPPIKFRYNIESDDDWQWQWTPHPDECIWYSVKDKYYQITATDLNKPPYDMIVDKNKIIPVVLPIRKHTSIDDNDDDNDDKEEKSIPNPHYRYDTKIPRFECGLPSKYEDVRLILSIRDPIPPHILNRYHLSTNAYQQVLLSELCNTKNIKCRFGAKDLGSGGVGTQLKKHPVLIFFENEPKKTEDVVWILHLIKNTETMKAAVEFDPKLWKRFKRDSWNISDETVELSDISLLDIAKWCVQYEQKHPDYTELYNNCRKFMLELSNYVNIKWNEIMLMEKIWYTMCPETQNAFNACYVCRDIKINKYDKKTNNDTLNMELMQEINDIVDNEWDSWHESVRKHPTRYDAEKNHKTSQQSNNKDNSDHNNNNNNDKNQKTNRNNQSGSGFNGNNGGRRNNDDEDDRDDKKKKNDKINDNNQDQDEDEDEDEDEEKEKKEMKEKPSTQTPLNRNANTFIPDYSNGLVSIKSPLLTINEKQLFPSKTNENNKGKKSFPNKCIAPKRAKGIIQISHKMAKTIIPEGITEEISNVYSFIDGSVKLQYHYHQFISLGDIFIFIFNLDFHDKITKETLYVVVEKQNGAKNRHYEYKMHNKLFTKKEIINIFYQNHMGIPYLPQSSRLNNNKFIDDMNHIHIICDILKCETRESIISRANWHKIPIFNNKKNNKQRMTLSLNKEVFIDKVINDTNNKQQLMHILVFDDINHRIVTIEYLQIVEVDKNTDIGISYKYDSKTNTIIPSRIYLQKQDILDVHQLVLPQHECHCLDNYKMSNITHLNIGNADSQLNRVKDLQKRNKDLKTRNKCLEKTNIKLTKENKKLNNEITKLQGLITKLTTNENKSPSPETLSNTTCSVPLLSATNTNIIQQQSSQIIQPMISNQASLYNQQPMIMGPLPILPNNLQQIQMSISNINIQQTSSAPLYIWTPIITTYPTYK